jgi:hypothetical protein
MSRERSLGAPIAQSTFWRLTAAVGVMALGLGSVLSAAKPPREVALAVTFGSGQTDTLRSDGRQAPGYEADYVNGLENVQAVLQSSGNFRFFTQSDTAQPPLRAMCFDFGAQEVPFARVQCVNVGQPMHSYTDGSDVPIQSLTYGQSVHKLTRFAWDDGGYRYRLGYGTDMDADGVQDAPGVTVTCIAPADTSKSCTTWVLAPESGSAAPAGTAALFQFALTVTKGRRGTTTVTEGPAVLIGHYVMPFVQTLTLK